MIHLDDAAVDAALAGADVENELRAAFVDFAQQRAAMQPRVRTDCGEVRLSTLGAIWPAREVAGAKIYTTMGGRFNFVIVLFSTKTGAPVATLDANAVTRWRTAAVSLLAARRFARKDASHLALFGRGVQARAHLIAFAHAFRLQSIAIVAAGDAGALVELARNAAAADVRVADARSALADADLVVTATRSKTPLFDGRWVAPGAFVAAVGSSKPDTRETDDALIERTRAIVVEWREQALQEAGDLVLADPAVLARAPVVELGEVLADAPIAQRASGDVTLFKSIGVGLEDVATAALAWRIYSG